MDLKRFLTGTLIFLSIVSGFLVITGNITHAQGPAAPDSTVLAKMDEILNNQKAIMAELAGIKEELHIIKIRVTQAQ